MSGWLTRPVYDTVSGDHLLIPQGARLLGRYQSQVSFGQDRALVVWERIMFPDGASIRITEPATDPSGAAGFSGRTDHHWDRVFTAAGLATLLGIGAEIGNDDDSDVEPRPARVRRQRVSHWPAGRRQEPRHPANICAAPRSPVRVLVTRDLFLRPYWATER
jgi:type IV secretion system protein VirB10